MLLLYHRVAEVVDFQWDQARNVDRRVLVYRREVDLDDVDTRLLVRLVLPQVALSGAYQPLLLLVVHRHRRTTVAHIRFGLRARLYLDKNNIFIVLGDYVNFVVTDIEIARGDMQTEPLEIFGGELLAAAGKLLLVAHFIKNRDFWIAKSFLVQICADFVRAGIFLFR